MSTVDGATKQKGVCVQRHLYMKDSEYIDEILEYS